MDNCFSRKPNFAESCIGHGEFEGLDQFFCLEIGKPKINRILYTRLWWIILNNQVFFSKSYWPFTNGSPSRIVAQSDWYYPHVLYVIHLHGRLYIKNMYCFFQKPHLQATCQIGNQVQNPCVKSLCLPVFRAN